MTYDGSELTEALAVEVLGDRRASRLAEEFGVTVRTIHRYRRELVSLERVTIDGWSATFARRRNRPPIRVTGWEWSKVDGTRAYRATLRAQVEAVRRR